MAYFVTDCWWLMEILKTSAKGISADQNSIILQKICLALVPRKALSCCAHSCRSVLYFSNNPAQSDSASSVKNVKETLTPWPVACFKGKWTMLDCRQLPCNESTSESACWGVEPLLLLLCLFFSASTLSFALWAVALTSGMSKISLTLSLHFQKSQADSWMWGCRKQSGIE